MLTRNYYLGLLHDTADRGGLPVSASYRDLSGTYRSFQNWNGSDSNYAPNSPFCSLLPSKVGNIDQDWCTLLFGTNDEEETFEDYTLGTTVTFASTIGTYKDPTYNSEDNTYTFTRRFVLTNNTSAAITINCYGIAHHDERQFLVYRGLLNTPFTVDIGESVNFDLSITYEMIADYRPYVPA